MARIPDYDAPASTRITPDSAGFSALEVAGRRIGPAYQQAASDYEKMGKIAAQELDQDKAPLEFSRFRADTAAAAGGGFKVKGSFDEGQGHGGAGRASRVGRVASDSVNAAQMTAGAPGLAQLASQMVKQQAANAKETETAQQGMINQQHAIEDQANQAYQKGEFAQNDPGYMKGYDTTTGNPNTGGGTFGGLFSNPGTGNAFAGGDMTGTSWAGDTTGTGGGGGGGGGFFDWSVTAQ